MKQQSGYWLCFRTNVSSEFLVTSNPGNVKPACSYRPGRLISPELVQSESPSRVNLKLCWGIPKAETELFRSNLLLLQSALRCWTPGFHQFISPKGFLQGSSTHTCHCSQCCKTLTHNPPPDNGSETNHSVTAATSKPLRAYEEKGSTISIVRAPSTMECSPNCNRRCLLFPPPSSRILHMISDS